MFMPSFFIKLIELGIATACLVLLQYSYDLTDVSTLILCSGTYLGFILVLTGEIIGEMISGKQDPFIEAWWSSVGAMLYGACAARTLAGWRFVPDSPRRGLARAAAICALAATSVLIIDAIRVLCEDDGSSIASSHHKLTKARGPKFGLDLTGAYNNSAPMCMTKLSPIRLIPAKVAIKDVPMTGGVNVDFHLNNAPMAGAAPKMTEKVTLSKLPTPLRMSPKVMRTFW